MSRDNVGEIHILIRPAQEGETKNGVEMSTSFNLSDLNLVLDEIKLMLLNGDLRPSEG